MAKQSIHLREKLISQDRISLYLDYYPPILDVNTNKHTRREFLQQYIIPTVEYSIEKYTDKNENPKKRYIAKLDSGGHVKERKLSKEQLTANKEALAYAHAILNVRINKFNKQELYSPLEREALKQVALDKKHENIDFLTFFLAEAKKQKPNSKKNWDCTLMHLKAFLGEKFLISALTPQVCGDFRNYLLNSAGRGTKRISNNTALSYFTLFKTAVIQAYKYDYIKFDITKYVKPIKPIPSKRNFLTLEDLNKLVLAPCKSDVLKRAGLFGALTGLRFGDIKSLTWENVIITDNGYCLDFRQEKTKNLELMAISEQAIRLADKKADPNSLLFEGLKYNGTFPILLQFWLEAAGITKHITFHCFRHTYAVLQLNAGTDLYALSKMMGHTNVATTQIYAKVLDKTKRDTTDRIILDLI